MARHLFFLPGKFLQWRTPDGNAIGRIISVLETTVSVSRWVKVQQQSFMDTYILPPLIQDAHMMDIIARLSISSPTFVPHADDFSSCRVRYIYGMRYVFCTKEQVNLSLPLQSLSVILYDAFLGLLSELQGVLNNQRQYQEAFSSFNMNASIITWEYLVEKLQIPVEEKDKVCTFLVSSGKDL
jgi:hypothetical protein